MRLSSVKKALVQALQSQPRISPWQLMPWLILFLGAGYVGYPLLKSAPLTHDHPTHLFKAWHMATQLLPSLRIRGFSHYWVFGFPSDELVPPGEEFWILFFRAVTFGHLSWLQTYGVSMFALLVTCAFSMFRFTRHYFGVGAGVVAGLLMVWDPGGWAQGGWEWAMTFGVWPGTLAVCCIQSTLISIEKLLARGNARQFVFTGAWVAAALIAHQVSLVFLPVMTALLLCDYWLRHASSAQRIALAVGACVFGVALSAFYVVPMLARSPLTLDLGVAGVSRHNVAHRLLELSLFTNGARFWVVLGFVGAIFGLRRRIPGAFFLAASAGVFVFLSTDMLIANFHAERLLPSLIKIEAQRMLYAAKVTWFPLVGYGVALLFGAVAAPVAAYRKRPSVLVQQFANRWTFATAGCLLLLAPYVAPACREFKATQIEKKVPSEEVEFFKDLQLVWAHTAKLRAASQEFYRVGYDLPMHDHISTLAPVFDNTFMYKVGYTPTQIFNAFPMHVSNELFRQLSLKYMVSSYDLDPSLYILEGRFGRLRFYRLKEFDPHPYSVLGPGTAELLEFAPERIRLKLRDTAANSKLKLHVTYIDHWRALLNGKPVRIVPATISGAEDPFLMEVPAGDGELVFEYVRRLPDWLGLLLTLSAIPIVVLARYVATRKREWLRLPQLPPRLHKLAVLCVGLAILLTAATAVARYRSKDALLPKASIFRRVSDGQMKVDGERCSSDGAFSWSCGAKYAIQARPVSGLYGSHLCMTTFGSQFELELPIAVGDFLRATYDTHAGDGNIRVWLDDQELGSVAARPGSLGLQFLQFDTREHSGRTATLHIEMSGSPLHCFDFTIAQ
ncbi:MAG: hypothetical protein ACOY0T_36385 [Myxococcota bacterium]